MLTTIDTLRGNNSSSAVPAYFLSLVPYHDSPLSSRSAPGAIPSPLLRFQPTAHVPSCRTPPPNTQAIAKNVNVVKANSMMSPGMEVSLFDCLSDVSGCLLACCCPRIVGGFNSARLDDRECTPCDCFANDYQTRQSMRAR